MQVLDQKNLPHSTSVGVLKQLQVWESLEVRLMR